MIQPNYTLIKLVEECYQVHTQLLALQKRDAKLRKELRDYMGSEVFLLARDYVVLIEQTLTTRFDKDQLMHDLGMEEYSKYETKVPGTTMRVRPATKVESEEQEVG